MFLIFCIKFNLLLEVSAVSTENKEELKAVSTISSSTSLSSPQVSTTSSLTDEDLKKLHHSSNFEVRENLRGEVNFDSLDSLDTIENNILKNLEDINQITRVLSEPKDNLETNETPLAEVKKSVSEASQELRMIDNRIYVEKSSTVIQVVDNVNQIQNFSKVPPKSPSISDSESGEELNNVVFLDAVEHHVNEISLPHKLETQTIHPSNTILQEELNFLLENNFKVVAENKTAVTSSTDDGFTKIKKEPIQEANSGERYDYIDSVIEDKSTQDLIQNKEIQLGDSTSNNLDLVIKNSSNNDPEFSCQIVKATFTNIQKSSKNVDKTKKTTELNKQLLLKTDSTENSTKIALTIPENEKKIENSSYVSSENTLDIVQVISEKGNNPATDKIHIPEQTTETIIAVKQERLQDVKTDKSNGNIKNSDYPSEEKSHKDILTDEAPRNMSQVDQQKTNDTEHENPTLQPADETFTKDNNQNEPNELEINVDNQNGAFSSTENLFSIEYVSNKISDNILEYSQEGEDKNTIDNNCNESKSGEHKINTTIIKEQEMPIGKNLPDTSLENIRNRETPKLISDNTSSGLVGENAILLQSVPNSQTSLNSKMCANLESQEMYDLPESEKPLENLMPPAKEENTNLQEINANKPPPGISTENKANVLTRKQKKSKRRSKKRAERRSTQRESSNTESSSEINEETDNNGKTQVNRIETNPAIEEEVASTSKAQAGTKIVRTKPVKKADSQKYASKYKHRPYKVCANQLKTTNEETKTEEKNILNSGNSKEIANEFTIEELKSEKQEQSTRNQHTVRNTSNKTELQSKANIISSSELKDVKVVEEIEQINITYPQNIIEDNSISEQEKPVNESNTIQVFQQTEQINVKKIHQDDMNNNKQNNLESPIIAKSGETERVSGHSNKEPNKKNTEVQLAENLNRKDIQLICAPPKTSMTIQIAQNNKQTTVLAPRRPSRIPLPKRRANSQIDTKSPTSPTTSKIPVRSLGVPKNSQSSENKTPSTSKVEPSSSGNEIEEVAKESQIKTFDQKNNNNRRSKSQSSEKEVMFITASVRNVDEDVEVRDQVPDSPKSIGKSSTHKKSLSALRKSSFESTTSSKQLSYTKSLDLDDSESSVSDSNVEELLDPSSDEDCYENFEEEYEEIPESDTEDYEEFEKRNTKFSEELNLNLNQISERMNVLTNNLKTNRYSIEETCESEEYLSEEDTHEEVLNEGNGNIEEFIEDDAADGLEDFSGNKIENLSNDQKADVKEPTELEKMEVRSALKYYISTLVTSFKLVFNIS